MNNTLLVNEVFETIQGEATHTGTPSVFLRLQGCPVGCHWCDTKHTWEVDEKQVIPIAQMKCKESDAPSYATMLPSEVLDMLKTYRAQHIVITGGEPCMYDLTELTTLLLMTGYSVQIETSGTFPIQCHPATFITLSPKINMAGKKEVLDEALEMADEIKYPIGKTNDVQTLRQQVLSRTSCNNVWLQPLSQSKSATAICVEQATLNDWKVSIQTHKFIGVR